MWSQPTFHASTSSTDKKYWKALYEKELDDTKREDEEFEKFEALFSRRVPKGLVGNEEDITDSDGKPTEDFASASSKGNGWVFLAIKEDVLELKENIPKEKELVAKIEDKDEWVLDNGCLHNMTGDKGKFLSLQEFDRGLVRFGDDIACMIKGKGTISLDGKNNTENVYYVEGLRHNLLSL
ncbi:hypothetical protein SUGI_1097500 [Cryptomeria japonica]|nr:hypothetical protein SUGI_1097500 [Cryptomeria japonica]